MPDGKVLVDVADAISSDQEVDWNRARGASQPTQRRALDNLRALSAIFGTHRLSGSLSPPHTRDEPGTAFARLALGSLVALSALLAVAALVMMAWSWDRYFDRQFALGQLLAVVLLFACALLLLRGGRFDHRAQLLGALYALGASSFALGMLSSSDMAALGDQSIIRPEVFSPVLMWAFVREFPRVHRRSRIDDVARLMVPISAIVGGLLWIVNATPLLERMPVLARDDVSTG